AGVDRYVRVDPQISQMVMYLWSRSWTDLASGPKLVLAVKWGSLDCVGNSEWGKGRKAQGSGTLTLDSSLELMDIAQKLEHAHAHAISMT
ncbi:hypothetical protein E4U15_001529, partial [Claviceps sp. LM218 group G6]